MGVVYYFYRAPEGRTGSLNDHREREYTARFTAITTATCEANTILTHPSCPRPWSIYYGADGTVDTGSWCRSVTADQDPADPTLWRITARYSSKLERPDINQIENPLLRPADISWGGETVTFPAETDYHGNRIQASSQERFDPAPEQEEDWSRLSITKNFLTYNENFIRQYRGAVNDPAWFGFPAGHVRCKSIDADRRFENGIFFWQLRAVFLIRETWVVAGTSTRFGSSGSTSIFNGDIEPWDAVILDRGYFELVSGRQVLMLDRRTGQPLSAPALLDGSGARLAVGGTPSWRVYQLRRRMDFSLLNLP